MVKRITYLQVAAVILLMPFQHAWAATISDKTCKSRWTLVPVIGSETFSFGAFTIESGSGTLSLAADGSVTSTGTVSAATSTPVATFAVTVNSTLDPSCGTFGIDLNWSVAPASLGGPGTGMPLTNVLVSEPSLISAPTALPITGLSIPTLPITLTFQAELTATFPQAAGIYTSPAFTLDLNQTGQGNAVSVSTSASATSLASLSIAEAFAMDFGMVASGSSGGTVVLDVNGNRTVTGDGEILAAGPGVSALFNITAGEPNLNYAITYGAGVLSDGAGNTVTVDAFTDSKGGLGTLTAAGTDSFNVGATLNLGAMQPAGNYSTANAGGSAYTVTVNYE